MARPSAYLIQLQESRSKDMSFQRAFTIQQCKDIACIALSEKHGYGEKRLKEFLEEFDKTMAAWTNFALVDDCDDVNIEYTKGKLDDRLRQALGNDLKPFDERYPQATKAVVYHNNVKHGNRKGKKK